MKNNKYAKVVSPTGKVHLAFGDRWKDSRVDPLCNHRSWRGDVWGQPWEVAKDQNIEVTCKRCRRVAGMNKEADTVMWICGQYKGQTGIGPVWEFQGVFDSKEKAIAACKDDNYFIGPAKLNEELPSNLVVWKGVIYPKANK